MGRDVNENQSPSDRSMEGFALGLLPNMDEQQHANDEVLSDADIVWLCAVSRHT